MGVEKGLEIRNPDPSGQRDWATWPGEPPRLAEGSLECAVEEASTRFGGSPRGAAAHPTSLPCEAPREESSQNPRRAPPAKVNSLYKAAGYEQVQQRAPGPCLPVSCLKHLRTVHSET